MPMVTLAESFPGSLSVDVTPPQADNQCQLSLQYKRASGKSGNYKTLSVPEGGGIVTIDDLHPRTTYIVRPVAHHGNEAVNGDSQTFDTESEGEVAMSICLTFLLTFC